MSFLYFLHIGLPGALKPDERNHRNSGFSIPACRSKGLCILPLFWGKRALILSKTSGKFRLPPSIAHKGLLVCLPADDELVLVGMVHVRAIQDQPGCMRGKGRILCCCVPHRCFAFPSHWQAADGDLMAAVTFLTEDPAPEPAQGPAWEGSTGSKQLPQGELHLCTPLQLHVFVWAQRGSIHPPCFCPQYIPPASVLVHILPVLMT